MSQEAGTEHTPEAGAGQARGAGAGQARGAGAGHVREATSGPAREAHPDRVRETVAGRVRETVAGRVREAAPEHGALPVADDRLTSVLRPVRAGNGFEEALEQILQVVRLGLVPGGERLPAERELADRLGISRVTLREVLKVLQDQGLVESRRGRYGGTFVLPRAETPGEEELRRRLKDVDVEDTLRFREVLEVGAAGLCAAHGLDEEQAGRLREALARTHDAPLTEYRRLDTLLHLTLAELSGSPSLTTQYAAVRASVNDLLDCIPLLVRNLEHSQRQHTALVEAVIEGNAECAREIMREHCAGTAALLRGFLG